MDITELITRFDHLDPEIMSDPAETYRRFRNECPVGWSNAHDGFWVVSRYDDVVLAAGDAERYCSSQGIAIPETFATERVEPQEADGPRHSQIRNQMNPWFAAGPVLAMRPSIEALSASLLDECIERGSFDLAVDYAVPLASLIMLRLLGIPVDHEGRLRENIDVLLHARADAARVAHASAELYECIGEILAEKRTSAPGDDLINKIMAIEIDGAPTTVAEQSSMVLSLVFAGLETSALAIASTAACLMDRPELRDRLIADPLLIPNAVDEFLRFISPVQAIGRRVTSEAQLGERTVNEGDRVMLLYGSANRDPEKFVEAEEIVLDRHPNRHVTFGYGVHRCLGRHLARLELDVALGHMLNLLPRCALTRQGTVEWSFGENRGIRSLPVTIVDEPTDTVREH